MTEENNNLQRKRTASLLQFFQKNNSGQTWMGSWGEKDGADNKWQ